MTDVPPTRDTVVIGGSVPPKRCVCGREGEWPGQPCPDCRPSGAVLPAVRIPVPTEMRTVERSKYDRAVLNNQRLRNLLRDVALHLEGDAEDPEQQLVHRADLRARIAELIPLDWGEPSRSCREPRP